MQRKQHEIRISETGTEYLLFIPANQKQRAKRVKPIKFDFSRQCWVYDRDLSNYYALIREFADDLTLSSSFTNPQEDEERSYLSDTLSEMDDTISTQDDEIKSLKAEGEEKDRENSGLQEEIDRLRGITEGINSLGEKISNKDGEIQSLNDAIGEKDRKNNELNKRIDQLKVEINTHKTTIEDLSQTLSEQEEEIQSLNDTISERNRKSDKLETQIVQLQDINTHPGIGDIAVRATEGNQAWSAYFRNLAINENLPITLRKWLEARLKQALSISLNHKPELSSLIQKYTNFDVDYSTEPDEFDKVDNYLAHVIRTQGNLIAHEEEEEEIYEKMIMGRALCCYFAAALLSSKLPEPKQPAFR